MCYSRDMDKPTLSPPIEHVISPPPEVFVPVPRAIVPPTEDDVVRMMAEEMQLFDDPAAQAMATRLLQAGYTVAATARKLGIRSTTVWAWADTDNAKAAIEKGRSRRRKSLGQNLEQAAEQALETLVEVAGDPMVAPQHRMKAAESILDRCGILPEAQTGANQVAIAVDIDFDDRLARIVAGVAPATAAAEG